MPKKVVVGVVTSDKMDKTRRVEIDRVEKHPRYGKYIRRKSVCIAHDENNTSKEGDTVEIEECRPMSKRKRWNFVSVVQESRLVDVAALHAANRAAQEEAK
ncbi:MAG: 30S ribosomal protein S17 [Planctomycetia bacterium]|nr:30S ribosomal protein S17 [Planctomycetia bacterium]MDO4583055.1 30S ribosomal protein S17 [Planctomycetia bacterium]